MAASPQNSKFHHHVRSNSLPSRTHPVISQFEENLCRLKASEATSLSSSSISHRLNGLQELHDCVAKLLLLPFTQQALAQEQHEKWVDELLDGSLELLDVCGIAKDALLQTKESTHELQSIMRRRPGGEMELTKEVRKYLTSRKVVKKTIQKAINGMERKCSKKNQETLTMVSMLREVEEITLSIFETLLSFIAGPKLPSKSTSWSFVSKLVRPKRVACEDEETEANELEKVDAALQSLVSHKTSKSDYITRVENVQNWSGKLESNIQDLEEVIECVFRRLIKTRVSLLNIFNH